MNLTCSSFRRIKAERGRMYKHKGGEKIKNHNNKAKGNVRAALSRKTKGDAR